MKLLITTQVVDCTDPVLGFFHEWLSALSSSFESIEVICLKEGEHFLPSHVHIHSLGKERGGGKLLYVHRFLTHLKKLHNSYDAVLVHMNPEYILLSGLLWKLKGKPVYLWYNHPKAGVRLALAMALADKVFHTSPFAASAGRRKSVRMPAGINVTLFKPQPIKRKPFSIYIQGRVAPSKRVSVACEALGLLRKRGINATLTVVGPEDTAYGTKLRERYQEFVQESTITFLGPKANRETPALYSAHAVALNLAASGHYDKTVLEALSCETPVIISGRGFEGIVPEEWMGHDTPLELADCLEAFFALTETEQKEIGKNGRRAVEEHESLAMLVANLKKEIF